MEQKHRQQRDGRPSAARPARRVPVRLLAGAVALIAASGIFSYFAIGDVGAGTSPGAQRLEVVFDEWTVELGDGIGFKDDPTLTIDPGRTSIVIRNDGEVDHELLVLLSDRAPDELPQGISGPVPELAGELIVGEPHQHISTNDTYAVLDRPPDENTEDHLVPGQEIVVDVDLEPGSYVLYCNLPGHYQRGQYVGLEVRDDDGIR